MIPFVPLAGGAVTPAGGPVRGAITIALVLIGVFFLAVGTVGLLRLPVVYNRLHATSKATTLGASSTLLAVTVHFGPRGPGLTALIAIVFLFLTVPTGSHLIARAAGRMGVAPLRERGDAVVEAIDSAPAAAPEGTASDSERSADGGSRGGAGDDSDRAAANPDSE
jgi:multicomponent Na+:H+ antiporter subunit G